MHARWAFNVRRVSQISGRDIIDLLAQRRLHDSWQHLLSNLLVHEKCCISDSVKQMINSCADESLEDWVRHTTDGDVNRKHFVEGNESLASVAASVEGINLILNGSIDETNCQDVANQFPHTLLAVGKKALANPDFVQRLKDGKEIADIDFSMLQPKATITNELAWRKQNAA